MFNEAYEANFVEVSRRVLRQNAKTVTDYVKVPVIGVVKFDGYGMGIAEAARAWQSAGVNMFAVSESWEALALRREGIVEDILLMAPVADRDVLTQLLENDIILTVSNLDNAWFYLRNSEACVPRVHVKVDTGMGRFGVRWTDIQQLRDIYAMEGLRFEGIFSHFGKSFEKTYKLTAQQLQRFENVVKTLTESGISVGMRHIANSCAALRFPETWLDAVRVGSALVAGLLAPVPVPLTAPHVCKARVVAMKRLKKGDTLGYAAVCKAKKDMIAAVVAVGFNMGFGMTGAPDPYPLRDFISYMYHLLQRYLHPPKAKFGNKQLPMVGRVGSMYTLFDATGVDIKPGDSVEVYTPVLQCTGKRIYTDE